MTSWPSIHSLKAPLSIDLVDGHDVSQTPHRFRRTHLPVLDPFIKPVAPVKPGRASAKAGDMAVRCIETAVSLAQAGCVSGLVTAPINKEAMQKAGVAGAPDIVFGTSA